LILIVDDQRFVRQMIADAIGKEEYDFLEAEDGQQALALFMEKSPDVVLMDAIMPNMTGFEACRLMREAEKATKRQTPILMITALSDVNSVNEGFAAGVNDFIQKPINLDILRRRLELMIKERECDEKVRKSEERFRLLAENARDFIIILQIRPLSYEYISPIIENITGYGADEFYSDPNLLRKIIYQRDLNKLDTIVAGGIPDPQLLEFRIIHKKGRVVFIESQAVPVVVNKNIVAMQIISRDITQRKQDEVRRRVELTKKVLFETVKALSATIEIRDPYTSGHQNRVAQLAVAIAKEMELDISRIDVIQTAALLHDIGKITVPAEYLSKPGELTDMEFSIIKHHPVVSYEILKPIEFDGPIAQIVYQHHERIDGSGYPLSLSCDEILLESKVIAVADLVEAMSSHRPYRAALGVERAIEEVSKNSGEKYDMEVGKACIDVFRKGDFNFSSIPFCKIAGAAKH